MAKREDPGALGRVRVLSLSGKSAGTSELLGDDPFAKAGLYDYTGNKKMRLLQPFLGPGSLEALVTHATESDILPQCVTAFQTNIDGFGHRFEPIVQGEVDESDTTSPEAKGEKDRLESFFKYAYQEGSFIELRKRKRGDQETMGIGYWEVIPDLKGDIVGLNHAPGHTIRMTALGDVVTVEERRLVGETEITVKVPRRFRAFCQIVARGGKEKKVWFKEFGDPRSMNLETGEYSTTKQGKKEANALIAFPVRYFALSPYPMPRWIGNLPAVLGSKAADEVNLLYFDNKTIPPLVITVSGGMLTRQSVNKIQSMIQNRIKGRENFHDALILEAAPPKDDGSAPTGPRQLPRIEVKPLTGDLIKDAMFLAYGERNSDKTRSSFLLTPVHTGQTIDYNRANAENGRLVVEEQVFTPERLEFDYWMNRRLLPALGATKWHFVSNGPNVSLKEDLITLLEKAEIAGGMTPNIARKIMTDVMETPMAKIAEPWGDLPFSLTKAMLGVSALSSDGSSAPPAKQVIDLMVKRMPRALKMAVLRELQPEIRKLLDANDGDLLRLIDGKLALAARADA